MLQCLNIMSSTENLRLLLIVIIQILLQFIPVDQTYQADSANSFAERVK